MRSRPKIFNTCIDWVTGETGETIHFGILLGYSKISDLDLADDEVIFVETQAFLFHVLDTMS